MLAECAERTSAAPISSHAARSAPDDHLQLDRVERAHAHSLQHDGSMLVHSPAPARRHEQRGLRHRTQRRPSHARARQAARRATARPRTHSPSNTTRVLSRAGCSLGGAVQLQRRAATRAPTRARSPAPPRRPRRGSRSAARGRPRRPRARRVGSHSACEWTRRECRHWRERPRSSKTIPGVDLLVDRQLERLAPVSQLVAHARCARPARPAPPTARSISASSSCLRRARP